MVRLRARERGRAIAQIEAIALLFPDVRPRSALVPATLEDVPLAERRRIIDTWTSRFPGRWAVLAGAVGDLDAAERALVLGAVRAAAGELKPCAAEGFAEVESSHGIHPGNALAAVIAPQTVWRYDTAADAAAAAAADDRCAAIAEIGFARFESCASKLAERVAWVEGQLPQPEYPAASAVLRNGCALHASRAGFDAEVACAVLEGYVRLLEEGFPHLHHFVEVT